MVVVNEYSSPSREQQIGTHQPICPGAPRKQRRPPPYRRGAVSDYSSGQWEPPSEILPVRLFDNVEPHERMETLTTQLRPFHIENPATRGERRNSHENRRH